MPEPVEQIYRIESPDFTAGLTVVAGRVTHADTIISWMRGKRWSEIERHCRGKRLKVSLINTSIPSSGPGRSGGTTPPASRSGGQESSAG